MRRTARSQQLPAAASLALRQPVLIARGVAERLRLSPQAALTLLKQLVAAGVLREATGRRRGGPTWWLDGLAATRVARIR